MVFYKTSLTLLFMIQVIVIGVDPLPATNTELNALCCLYEINFRMYVQVDTFVCM